MKSILKLCERIVKDGQMWCNTHNRPHSVCRGGPYHPAVPGKHTPLLEETEGKIFAYGSKRAYTPPEGEK